MDDSAIQHIGSHIVMPPVHTDKVTGAVWRHKDYELAIQPFVASEYRKPVWEEVDFRDLGSWAAYIARYGRHDETYITRNNRECQAILDYHPPAGSDSREGGRCTWRARLRWELDPLMLRWREALGPARLTQDDLVQLLDESAPYIVETDVTDSAAIMRIVSTLRVTTMSTAETEIREDGTTSVSFSRDSSVRGSKGGETILPPVIQLALPMIGDHQIRFSSRLRLALDGEHLQFSLRSADFESASDDVLSLSAREAQAALEAEGINIKIHHTA